ncbi:FAD-dependent monooxygenase [Nocardia asteroides]|uniref:FAD-dependent monooxygenase n=1 Tax=Nocardia asteroides TaxID=1824 RepID=UPI00342CA305
MNRDDIYDVAQIGYGPAGQVMAALLGRCGLRVAVFERMPRRHRQGLDLPDAPVEGTPQILQAVGVNTSDFDSRHGEAVYASMGVPSVRVNFAWEAMSTLWHDNHTEIRFRSTYFLTRTQQVLGDDQRTVRARFLIGADGPDSFVRQQVSRARTGRVDTQSSSGSLGDPSAPSLQPPTGSAPDASPEFGGQVFLIGAAADAQPMRHSMSRILDDAVAIACRLSQISRSGGMRSTLPII